MAMAGMQTLHPTAPEKSEMGSYQVGSSSISPSSVIVGLDEGVKGGVGRNMIMNGMGAGSGSMNGMGTGSGSINGGFNGGGFTGGGGIGVGGGASWRYRKLDMPVFDGSDPDG